MRIKLKNIVLLIVMMLTVFLSTVDISIAVNNDQWICYNVEDGDLKTGFITKQQCLDDEYDGNTETGYIPIIQTSNNENWGNENRLCCNYEGSWYKTAPSGEVLYNNEDIKSLSYFSECSEVKAYEDSCLEASEEGVGDPSTEDGNPIDDTVGGGVNDEDEDLLDDGFKTDEEAAKFCSERGGLFGLFTNLNSCEGSDSCLYNPYYSGYFKTYNILNDNKFDNGCIAKRLVKTCFDYKNEKNCNENVVFESHEGYKNLEYGCKWVNTTTYDNYNENLFSNKGVCISKYNDLNKSYNFKNLSLSDNVIKNPSFENGSENWENSVVKSSEVFAYHGKKYLKLETGKSVSQIVENFIPGDNLFYGLLYARNLDEIANAEIKVEIEEFSKNGNLINTKDYTIKTKSNYYFNKLMFPNNAFITFNKSTEKIKITITSLEKTVLIDSVFLGNYFEDYETVQYIKVNNNFKNFKPVENIRESASSCDICFDENDLNLCTKQKSDLLGDCTYMVDDKSTEYRYDNNFYEEGIQGNKRIKIFNINQNMMGDEDEKNIGWKSQSIANSKLFCEMYLYEQQCINPENYVNKNYGWLHQFKGDTLCKWDEKIGCYKDSNNDNLLDSFINDENRKPTELASIKIRNQLKEDGQLFRKDFKGSCDSIPPNVYVYFEGKNVSAQNVEVKNIHNIESMGDVDFYIEVFDQYQEACEGYLDSSERNITIHYLNTNGGDIKQATRFFSGDDVKFLYKKALNIKDYFVDKDNKNILFEGKNNLRIKVFDQSGNIGFDKIFEFTNLDISAPEITPLDENKYYPENDIYSITGTKTRDDVLNFIVEDKTEIKNCSFELEDRNKNLIPEDDYNTTGFFESILNPDNKKWNIQFNISKIIKNVLSPSGSSFDLNITCNDIFNQESYKNFVLKVDYDTQFVLESPLSIDPIQNPKDSVEGFLSGATNFHATSSDSGSLEKCYIKTNDGSLLNDNKEEVEFEVEYNANGFDEGKFFNNITGEIIFKKEGMINVTLGCVDENNNKFEEEHIFYNDVTAPKLVSMSLNDSSEKRVVLKKGENYYIRSESSEEIIPFKINLTVDGTHTWISELSNVSFNGEVVGSVVSKVETFNDSKIGNIFIEPFYRTLEWGVKTVDDVYKQNIVFNFSDRSGNIGSGTGSFFIDNSTPKLIFNNVDSTEVFSYEENEQNLIYVKNPRAEFNIDMNTPNYRKWDCSVVSKDLGNFKLDFKDVTSFGFKIMDLGPNALDVTGERNIEISCKDEYDVVLENSFILRLDNTKPVIKNIYLNPEAIFARAYPGQTLDDISNVLNIVFNDTNEDWYNCSYSFETIVPDKSFNCKNDYFAFNNEDNLYEKEFNSLIVDNNEFDYCSLGDIKNEISNSGYNLDTSLKINVQCIDRVNLPTSLEFVLFNVTYTNKTGIQNFEINVDGVNRELNFNLKTLTSYEKIDISYVDEFSGKEIILFTLTGNEAAVDGTFIYDFSKSIEEFALEMGSNFVNGRNVEFTAKAYLGGQNPIDEKSQVIIVDLEAPKLKIDIPDKVVINNSFNVFSDAFNVLVNAVDSNLGSVEFFINDEVKEGYSEDDFENYILDDLILFENTTVGDSYIFKLFAVDTWGNSNEVSINVKVMDGPYLYIMENDEPKVIVDENEFSWITKSIAPIIKFNTTRRVEECIIDPFVSFENKPSFESIVVFPDENDVMSYDLSKQAEFDLSKVSEEIVDIKILCLYNDVYYNYTRKLEYFTKLPDYVLESSEGFVLNGKINYTNLTVRGVNSHVSKLKCSLNDELFNENFTKEVSKYVEFESGSQDLKIKCENQLGTFGPEINYKMEVNPNVIFDVSYMKLSLGDKDFVNYGNNIYVSEKKNLDLEFVTNRRDGDCKAKVYRAGTGVFDSVFNPIVNLFRFYKPVENIGNELFKFTSKGIDLDDTSKIIVKCGDDKEEFIIKYSDSSSLDFNLTKIN